MRIVFNLTSTWEAKTGVGHYAFQLFRAIQRSPGDHRIEAFPGRWLGWMQKTWERLRPRRHNTIDVRQHESRVNPPAQPPHVQLPLARLRRWGIRVLERHRAATFFGGKYDLYHEPNFIPEPSDCTTLSTVHDLSGLLHPEWHPAARLAWYQQHFERTLEQSQHYLAVSDFTRLQMIQHLGLKPEQVTRVYNGYRADCRPLPKISVLRRLDRLKLPKQYLLCVGTVEPRKNVLRLLQAYCSLPESLRASWPLLLAGPWGWNAAPIADYYESEASHRGVRHLGYLSDADLVVLYNGARALVYPSLYEGFGLPVLEMMACGGAVITSTADALREISGGHAHHVAPEDFDGWRSALVRILRDDDWRQQLRHGVLEHAQSFTWERCAAETLAVYRKLGEPRVQSAAA